MNYFLSKANILYSIKIENLSAWMEKYSKPENREKETTDPVCQINVECAAKYAIYKNNVKYFRNASLDGSQKKIPRNSILNPTLASTRTDL